MFSSTSELAEDKLLLLYIFKKIKLPISNSKITQIILENNFINYFVLQQYLTELEGANFIRSIEQDGKHRIAISNKGIKVLSLFKNRISGDKIKAVNSYLKNQLENIKNETTIFSDYTIEGNNYIVNLKAVENDSLLMDLKLTVASNKQAKELCSKWRKNSSKIYTQIIKMLVDS